MKRCPECHRFGIEYREGSNTEVCIWNDCLWVNENHIDLDKVKHPFKFQKFANALKNKHIRKG